MLTSALSLLLFTAFAAEVSLVDFGSGSKAIETKEDCSEFCDELKAVNAIIRAVVPLKGADKEGPTARSDAFSVAGCKPIPIKEWVKFLFLDAPIRHGYAYADGCDIEGTAVIDKRLNDSTIKLRKVGSVTRALVPMKVTINSRAQDIEVKFNAIRGKLHSKKYPDGLPFNADYLLYLDHSGQLRENKGGKIELLPPAKGGSVKPFVRAIKAR